MEVKHYIEYARNFDITGYCAGIRMQLWVYNRLCKMCGAENMPEFVVEV